MIDEPNSGAAGFATQRSKFAQLLWKPTMETVSIWRHQMCALCWHPAASEQFERIPAAGRQAEQGKGYPVRPRYPPAPAFHANFYGMCWPFSSPEKSEHQVVLLRTQADRIFRQRFLLASFAQQTKRASRSLP
jgi:hypothetical protein